MAQDEMSIASAEALWHKVRAGTATEAELRTWEKLKAAMWRESRKGRRS